uniref:Protein quiver n=1 Tax=Syphacia muris TaxID=451379 RepID=A0A0N5AH66_9BILA
MLIYQLVIAFAAFQVLEVAAVRTEVCYQCNSAIDADCASSSPEVLMKFKKKCEPELEHPPKNMTPIACRKVNQHLSSNPVRVIRECAYSEDPNLNGMRKQGSKGIYMWYYQCENTNEVCSVHTFLNSGDVHYYDF